MLQRLLLILFSFTLVAGAPQERVPGEKWMQFANPSEAGFDAQKLEAIHETWKSLPSSAFMVIADGAVVAAWGETERRFMCHSVRKSFLSAIFGIYWDRDQIELNKTLEDMGIDEPGEGLLDGEKNARILDLLKARSGVFHPAAYAGRTDSKPRGSQGPGRYFAYNNWDFNTLAAILEIETGNTVFKAFDSHFGQPLQMEDWRLSDGYFHYERDKSQYPAYPFRMSARDAARFGLLFARQGTWGDRQILSKHWVRRSTALYSKDNDRFGYGFMWWVSREKRFEKHGFVAAWGVGRQLIVALPESDMVLVNRANTYLGEGTPLDPLLDMFAAILDARTGESAAQPRLVPMPEKPADPRFKPGNPEDLEDFVGSWPYPPTVLGLNQSATVEVTMLDGYLKVYSSDSGTFRHYLQADGSLLEEDSLRRYYPIRDDRGAMAGLADRRSVLQSAVLAAAAKDSKTAKRRMALVEMENDVGTEVTRALVTFFKNPKKAEKQAATLAKTHRPQAVEAEINVTGYRLMGAGKTNSAQGVFELNTRIFPEAFNTWDSLGEVLMNRGKLQAAIESYEKSLQLNPDNTNAREMIKRMKKSGDGI